MTYVFYGLASSIELAIFLFLAHFWRKANEKKESALQWRWTDEDSRNMWIDAAKTMITAAGIAAALVASLSVTSERPSNPIVIRSVKVATISLIICVCASMPLILALSRGHENAKSRAIEEQRAKGMKEPINQGALSNFALGIVLVTAFLALSGFFLGFLFLGRIVWHF